jgi:hypothetical protein
MKKTGRIFITCLLVAALAVGMLAVPAAASGSSAESTARADKLVSLHLFKGTNNGYELDSTPTRMQGLVMLIRLLGLEDEALACTGETPFTDLTWGKSYVAYAYEKGLTNGTGATTFSPNDTLSAASYVTFLLRALGYDDSEGDFSWGTQFDFAVSVSMMTKSAAQKLKGLKLNRGDMVDLSYAALTCSMKGEGTTLAQKLQSEGVFTYQEGVSAGVLGSSAGWVYEYTAYDSTTVSYQKKYVSTSGGTVTANVITVNTHSSRVKVKTAMVNNTVGATAAFSSIVQSSGAIAVINGNFFNAYDAFKVPIGHVMVNGEFLYGNSGISSLGITSSGDLRVGRPALFTRIKPEGINTYWAAYEINVNTQISSGSVLYTPAFGKSVTPSVAGAVMTVENGKITAYKSVSAGQTVSIPTNGYVVFMGTEFTQTDYFRTPTVGTAVSREYYLRTEDEEGFTLDDVVSVVSGAPRLVKDGKIVTTLESGFTEARFTTASTPRTAVGVDANDHLLLVSVPSATIQQMRELMLSLGCVDAINLDGGASCAMYYNGSYIATPGRALTVTLQVFLDK